MCAGEIKHAVFYGNVFLEWFKLEDEKNTNVYISGMIFSAPSKMKCFVNSNGSKQ